MQLLLAEPKRALDALRADIDRAIAGVLDSGHYILGEQVQRFEEEFAAAAGCRHAIGVASGTDALRLALLAAGVEPGDEVITVANAGDPTPMAICSIGAIPRFVDVEPDTLTMSPKAVERAIGPRTKAILPVHLYGQMADMKALCRLVESAGVPLIEDACQAHGAKDHGQPAGSVGDLGCFSFYPTKNLGGLGDGGLVTTNNDGLAERVRLIREYGWQRRNHSATLGVNSRLDELQAAVLRVKLPRLPAWVERRRAIAAAYAKLLAGSGLTLPVEAPERHHAYHLYAVRTPARDALAAKLAARGIGTGLHYPVPAYRQPPMLARWPEPEPLPVTEQACAQELSLPLFPEMTDLEVQLVSEAVTAAE